MAKPNGNYIEFSAGAGAGWQLPKAVDQKLVGAAGQLSCQQCIETDGEILADGRILDLVRSLASEDEVALLAWHDGEFTVSPQVEFNGRIYLPPRLPKGLGRAVRSPSGIGPLRTARELVHEIETRAHMFLEISDNDAFLIAVFTLCTFFADRLPFVPYSVISGPPGSGKTRLLRFLHCATRRALHAGEISPASLYRLTDLLCPTLLIDEANLGRDQASQHIMRLLRNGNHPGADAYRNGRRFRTFGPKVICGSIDNAALASRAIHITMLPSDRVLPVFDFEAEQELAHEMQPKLQMFRLVHYRDVRLPERLIGAGLTPRIRDIAQALAAPLLGDTELVERLLTSLGAQDQEARILRYEEPEWAVALALLDFCHRGSREVYIGNLAEAANRIRAELGETNPLSARKVGTIARTSLAVGTKKVGRGFYFELTSSRRREIHNLARRMGLARADLLESSTVRAGYAGPPCRLCLEFGLLTLPDGRTLRWVDLPILKDRRRLFYDDGNAE